MNLFSLLESKTILSNLEVNNKKELISVMVDTLEQRIGSENLEAVRKGVLEREKIMSTGVGKGLAIPHCKSQVVNESFGSFAILKEPLDFNSIDNQPVQLVFLLISPDSKNSLHIKLLSRVSRLMNSGAFREKVTSCTSSAQILEAFKEEEEKYFVN